MLIKKRKIRPQVFLDKLLLFKKEGYLKSYLSYSFHVSSALVYL